MHVLAGHTGIRHLVLSDCLTAYQSIICQPASCHGARRAVPTLYGGVWPHGHVHSAELPGCCHMVLCETAASHAVGVGLAARVAYVLPVGHPSQVGHLGHIHAVGHLVGCFLHVGTCTVHVGMRIGHGGASKSHYFTGLLADCIHVARICATAGSRYPSA